MPWWAATYFGIYTAFSVWSLYDDHRSKEQAVPEAIAIMASDVLLVAAALSFWLDGVRSALGDLITPAFGFGVALFIVELVLALRRHITSEPTFSTKEKIGVGGFSATLALIMVAPIMLWGFRVAVLGEHVDA